MVDTGSALTSASWLASLVSLGSSAGLLMPSGWGPDLTRLLAGVGSVGTALGLFVCLRPEAVLLLAWGSFLEKGLAPSACRDTAACCQNGVSRMAVSGLCMQALEDI